MEPSKMIQYIYFLNIGCICSGIYLIILYSILGDMQHAGKEVVITAAQLATTLWFRKRYDLWP